MRLYMQVQVIVQEQMYKGISVQVRAMVCTAHAENWRMMKNSPVPASVVLR